MCYTLITGASSGIGYEFTKICARKGHNLILVARNGTKLQQIAGELQQQYPVKMVIIPQDLSEPDAADHIFKRIHNESLTVENLINNACFYIRGPFMDTPWEEELALIQLQCISQIKLIKLLLPDMKLMGRGRVLNVCSTGSFVPGPFNAIYCAAKSFLLSFSEALGEELKGTGISISALCPGGTNTPFQDLHSRKKSLLNPLMEASKVAEIGYRGFMRGKRVIIPGQMNNLQVFALRFLPRRMITRLSGKAVYQSIQTTQT
ncbi:MAG TPA: SDR family oxidoreductase [Bacteroidales bacterium]|nr:SDR family oxidoreductase [Bacteroidales bacterium]HRZ50250.1 SDR family oxidoreductase [Bacteroidales bacterium]